MKGIHSFRAILVSKMPYPIASQFSFIIVTSKLWIQYSLPWSKTIRGSDPWAESDREKTNPNCMYTTLYKLDTKVDRDSLIRDYLILSST